MFVLNIYAKLSFRFISLQVTLPYILCIGINGVLLLVCWKRASHFSHRRHITSKQQFSTCETQTKSQHTTFHFCFGFYLYFIFFLFSFLCNWHIHMQHFLHMQEQNNNNKIKKNRRNQTIISWKIHRSAFILGSLIVRGFLKSYCNSDSCLCSMCVSKHWGKKKNVSSQFSYQTIILSESG